MRTCLLITTYNRTPLLRQNLERLTHRTCTDEVLVVDDGGSDGCSNLCDEPGMTANYVYTHNPGQAMCSHARNVGIKETDSDIVITCEPEMVFETDVIAQLLKCHEEYPDSVITAGTILRQRKDGLIERQVGWAAPYIALYERQWLLDIGGWDEGFPVPYAWEDVDLLTRLRLSGHGHFVDNTIEATHLYHEPGWYHTPEDVELNWEYFQKKDLQSGDPDNPEIVANRSKEWGVIKCR